MTFEARINGAPVQIKDDYLKRYCEGRNGNGEIDLHELTHRFRGQIIGHYQDARNRKTGKIVRKCTPYKVRGFDLGMGTDDNIYPVIVLDKYGASNSRKSLNMAQEVFQWDVPKLGVINYKDTVIFTYMNPSRQWRRGVQPEAIETSSPMSLDRKIMRSITEKRENFINKSTVLQNLYDPIKYNFEQAYDKVNSGKRLSAAFSYKFFLTNSFMSENILVGYKTHLVGEINNEGTINLTPNAEFLLETLAEYRPCEIMEVKGNG